MKLVVGALMVGTASAVATLGHFDEIVAKVNKGNHGWTAEKPNRFGSIQDVKDLCGTWTEGHPNYKPANLPKAAELLQSVELPTDFDGRTQWPKCTVISKVRDQSSCGSCWAFGSTEAFSASRCIATGEDIMYSADDTAACCSGFACGFSQGCNGGQPSSALHWMTKTGVVTGGDFTDIDTDTAGCLPYPFAPCAHHVPPSAKYPACPSKEYSAQCQKSCVGDSSKTYSSDKTKGVAAKSYGSINSIKQALMTTGPLAVAFTVYEDFPTYKSGVYKHVSGSALGGHAVNMVGWGVEDGEEYWLVKNSWNEMWGDGGFFKIAHGECGIENDVTGIHF